MKDTKHRRSFAVQVGSFCLIHRAVHLISTAVLGGVLGVSPLLFAAETSSHAVPVGATNNGVVALNVHFDAEPESSEAVTELKLRGSGDRRQLLATATLGDGALRDQTRQVTYAVAPEGVVRVEKTGLVIPLADGKATVTVQSAEQLSARLNVKVERFEEERPINFANQIVPIFTKAGCNGGGCHGKSGGQNGFRLSLLGFEPAEDYEHLVKEARGRRLFPAAPERSLLMLKGAATLPHGGGKRLEIDSDDYRLLVRWMAQGMPYGEPDDPTIERIEVIPKSRFMPLGGQQQLAVLAHYTDGAIQDVTRSALYEANDKEMAETAEDGYVTVFKQPGDVAVMIRYQGKVATFRATVPLGAPVEDLPEPKNFVDELVFKKLRTVGMPASAVCDDPTFLRRVTIDVTGRLPTPTELDRFLADKNPAKRDLWIDQLLDSPEYGEYFANKWAALFRNKRTASSHAWGTYAFYNWIRDSLVVNKPFDQFVREIIGASGDVRQNPPVAWYRQVRTTTSQMEDTAQLLLGQRLQCAQCHHHPYERWSQSDYYSFSAFFSRVGRKGSANAGEEIIFHNRGVAQTTNKKTQLPEKPAGLGSDPVTLSPDDDPRQALADWMTGQGSHYFSSSLVNRYWKHFLNRGLVEPEDDMRETNPPTNPDLLDALTRHFRSSGYDLKDLVRTICRSKTYQLSSMPNDHNAVDKQNYSRYYPERLTAEVLFDAINRVTKHEAEWSGLPDGTRAVCLPDNSFNSSTYFLQVFGRPESASACECERSQDASLAQSLHLLNSKDIQSKVSAEKGRALSLAQDSDRTDEAKLQELYQWAFSRDPQPQEVQVALAHLDRGRNRSSNEEGDPINGLNEAYEDIVWALLNTKEFLFNH